jgi:hypothetical protein
MFIFSFVCCSFVAFVPLEAKSHPELAAPNEIVFTYISNRRGAMTNVYEEGELETYVPLFVRLVYQLESWQATAVNSTGG